MCRNISDPSDALSQRTAICVEIQCYLRFVLFPSLASDMAPIVMADTPVWMRAHLFPTKHIRLQFPRQFSASIA